MSSLPGKTLYASGYQPLNATDCVLWLDAADSNTLTLSGSNVIVWRDKGPFRYDASASTVFPTYDSNNKCLVFNGTNQQITGNAGIVNTIDGTFSVFAVALSSASGLRLLFNSDRPGSNAPQYLRINSTNVIESLGYRTGTTYTISAPSAVSLNTKFLTSVINTGGANNITNVYLNGTIGANSAGNDLNSRTFYYNIGSSNNTANYWQGNVYEIIAYSNVLSTSQRQQVEGYLSWKWGLTSVIPSTHPFKTYPIYTRLFQPADICGCLLWLDGADVCGNGINPATGTTISSWFDKSGNGRNFFQSTAGNRPTFTANGVSFNGTSSFMATTSNPNLRRAQFTVCARPLFSTTTYRGILRQGVNNSTELEYTAVIPGNRQYVTTYYNTTGSSVSIGGNSITSNATDVVSSFWAGGTATSNVNLYMNGTKRPSSTLAGNQLIGSSTSPLYLGCDLSATTGLPAFFWLGTINEVIYYDHVLSDQEVLYVESYLSDKWKFKTRLNSSHDFLISNALVPLFTPFQISNFALWLDAMDTTKITSSESTVTSVVDKAQSITLTRQGTSSALTTVNQINNNPSFYFSNASSSARAFLSGTLTNITAGTSFMVIQAVDQTNDYNDTSGAIFTWNNTTNLTFPAFGYVGNVTNNNIGPFTTVGAAGTPLTNVTAGSNYIFSYSWTGTTTNITVNGGTITAGSQPAFSSSSTALRIGFNNGGYFIGYLGELLLYRSVVSFSERRRVEGYLAHKWGLSSLLPGTHPYRKFRP